MRSLFNRPSNQAFRTLVIQLTCGSVGWASLVVVGFGALFFLMALLGDMPAADHALDFMLDAVVPVSDVVVRCWLVAFFLAAGCFGAGQELAGTFLPPPVRTVVVRLTQTAAIFAPAMRICPAIFAGACWGFNPIARPSRIVVSTAAELAGPAPRLE